MKVEDIISSTAIQATIDGGQINLLYVNDNFFLLCY